MAERLKQEQDKLFDLDPDQRDERRNKKLGRLPLKFTNPLRGKKRISSVELPLTRPNKITDESIMELSQKLERPLTDNITRYYNIRTAADLDRYVSTGNKYISSGTTPEEKQASRAKKIRQTQHTADLVQRDLRTKLRAAEIYDAALASVKLSIESSTPMNPTASRYVAAAIEDYGICLRGSTDVLDTIPNGSRLPHDFELLGVYAVDEPIVLVEQPLVLELVQLEQVKRIDLWRIPYNISFSQSDRRTVADKQNDIEVEELILSFNSDISDQPIT